MLVYVTLYQKRWETHRNRYQIPVSKVGVDQEQVAVKKTQSTKSVNSKKEVLQNDTNLSPEKIEAVTKQKIKVR